MNFKLSHHVREAQGPAIMLAEDFLLECAGEPDRIKSKPNYPHQFELQKDLQCGYTLAMAVDPGKIPNTLLITTVYPKGITRERARDLWDQWSARINSSTPTHAGNPHHVSLTEAVAS